MSGKCKATAKGTGQRCQAWAMAGSEVCRVHGGRAPQVKAAAARRLAEQAAQQAVRTLGLPVDISPTEALLEEVRWTAGHVAWLRSRVQELAEEPTHRHVSFDGEDEDLLEAVGELSHDLTIQRVWHPHLQQSHPQPAQLLIIDAEVAQHLA